MKYFIKTFGCQQNYADSERIAVAFKNRGMTQTKDVKKANYIIINTCMVRESAENRVYGLVNNLAKLKIKNSKLKIIITGCMVGLAIRDKIGKYLKRLKEIMPQVDEFIPIEEVGFDFAPLRTDKISAWVPISNGCNNFCTYCIVPYTRGREVSRPYEEIIKECKDLKKKGYKNIILLGQNVNSYGSDLISKGKKAKIPNSSFCQNIKPVYVKHLGRYRIPTLFPYLLEEVAKMGFEKVDFISSNPWDFSDELIDVIARNKNITRTIHLPVQSGDDNVLKRMNRWYTRDEYLELVANLKLKIKNLKLTTDIIVGFCGETEKEFKNTIKLCKKVGFSWAYISQYSPRPMTLSIKLYKDDIPHKIKEKRWKILDDLINKPHLVRYQSTNES
ncbi:tRNA (N6-isopentenyl adenosine(37)-C2)-methylthiotransferase MiaB [Candidatus Roizmanbacteria bacterium CG_4_10_14_0_8_um_filter_36_36]|uniref:tRNA-2-methylthio-N(6)-dimethylallyladenosine synthase n=2 Tax=Candidatus Roizmaniibacteriota TaxID=1752723 RepID=A0A2M8F1M0_9BACT|nr:MAG: tRNA (N6-isopentenyl adenosine(37)-C2)-methylthiotransferase MiaB [Candidatus Roizmanbacteria bacterium CG23_combo_of_CG06-09_8_20_14_all_35_49]PIY70640.1 MAG: tRNA (N6-isopentenyl adenosine(37)-C2)-methylthiotransferase MiaB [Candidatus Roizmanbacteria bacterium CG_4_10_14_0_8_um_filter_36_36]PJC33194.1 MAG: tRNA (N6-isopentenyl adenosine(37)-C2)-methylthiotransferase MiaB [Candidatus Roizmanbacteria bacterium CG_4_9_14_0_2_um_filter_35_15]